MKKNLFFLIILFSQQIILAQETKFYGNKFVEYYAPEDYKDDSQIWAIARDKHGVMYFAASNLVSFDGIRWKKYKAGKTETLRSISISENGRIYIGGYQEFGYFEPDNNGELQYTTLTDLISDTIDFKTVWKVIASPDTVLFIADFYLFVYDGKKVDVFHSADKIFQSQFGFRLNGQNYISVYPQGISQLKQGEIVPLLDTTKIKGIPGFINLLPISDNEIMLFTSDDGIYRYTINSDTLRPFKIDEDVYDFIRKNIAYQVIQLNDTSYAAGTLRGGVIIFDKNGQLVNIYNQNRGLKSNSIYTLFSDNIGDLWVGTDNGINRIETSSPIMFYDAKQNLTTYPTKVIKYDNRYYLGSLTGCYYFDDYKITSNDNHILKDLKEIKSAWDLLIFKNKLYCCGVSGLYRIDGTNSQVIYKKTNLTTLGTSKLFPDYLFVGMSNGIFFCKINGNTISDKHEIPDLQLDIRQIEQDEKGNLWLGTHASGVVFVHLNPENILDYKLTVFSKIKDSIELGRSRIFNWDNKFYLLTEKGIYEIIYPAAGEADSLFKFKKAEIFMKHLPSDTTAISKIIQINDTLFLLKGKVTGFINPYDDKKIDTIPFRKINSISIVSFLDNYLFLSRYDAEFIYDLKVKKDYRKKYYTKISKIVVGGDSVIFNGYYYTYSKDSVKEFQIEQPENFIPKLNYTENSVTIEFSGLFFENNDEIQYSYYLEGYEDTWRPYSFENKAIYTNLNEGEYTFFVKAKNIFGIESYICSYKFKILPPWYRTWWAYLIFVSILIGIIYVAVKLYTRRLKQANIRLEKIVAERTKQITEQNQELRIQKEELQQQKEEILTQAEELERINKELEKLSIVAEKTDNAVLIFDKNLDLVWVNAAYEKIYGEKAFFGKKINLLGDSTSKEIKTIIESMLDNRKSVTYKNIVETEQGIRYVQTSLTPVFTNNELSMIIAIESDITEIEQANRLIAEKNKVIEDSLKYAETIQKAILPNPANIKKIFDFELIYRPKDIVSGDFYWFTQLPMINNKYEYESIMIVADCTGHGVPGAFMSLIAGRLLDETITYEKIYDPAEILNTVSDKVIKVLRQDTTDNNDGFDIAVCRISKLKKQDTAEVVFAGAKMAIFYYDAEEKKLNRLRGNIRRIGVSGQLSFDKKFSNNYFKLTCKDTLYMMSDGYIDQNNAERKKFGTKNLMATINEIVTLPVVEQIKYLEIKLLEWQGTEMQRDDITLCALKIK